MNYVELHLGDYLRDTAHLTPQEHGIYLLLLMRYYADEQPIADAQAHRYGRASRAEVEPILSEFFVRDGDVWRHRRVDAELAKYAEKREKARSSANARWSANRPESNPDATAMRTHSDGNADGMLTSHQSPVTREDQEHVTPNGVTSPISDEIGPEPAAEVEKPKRKPVPFEAIVAAYHETLPELPRCEVLTAARKGAIRQRWTEHMPALDDWRNFFTHVRGSPFLMGRAPPQPGKPPFRADLEWLTRAGNFAKIAEGRYHR